MLMMVIEEPRREGRPLARHTRRAPLTAASATGSAQLSSLAVPAGGAGRSAALAPAVSDRSRGDATRVITSARPAPLRAIVPIEKPMSSTPPTGRGRSRLQPCQVDEPRHRRVPVPSPGGAPSGVAPGKPSGAIQLRQFVEERDPSGKKMFCAGCGLGVPAGAARSRRIDRARRPAPRAGAGMSGSSTMRGSSMRPSWMANGVDTTTARPQASKTHWQIMRAPVGSHLALQEGAAMKPWSTPECELDRDVGPRAARRDSVRPPKLSGWPAPRWLLPLQAIVR